MCSSVILLVRGPTLNRQYNQRSSWSDSVCEAGPLTSSAACMLARSSTETLALPHEHRGADQPIDAAADDRDVEVVHGRNHQVSRAGGCLPPRLSHRRSVQFPTTCFVVSILTVVSATAQCNRHRPRGFVR